MTFLEKDLETIIWEASDSMLEKRGLPFSGKRFRQLHIGNYGIADLVTAEREPNGLNITIYELKQDRIGIGAFLQAVGYARGIKSYLERRRNFHSFYISIALIGRDIDTSGCLCYLTDLIYGAEQFNGVINSLWFYTYKYNIDGIRFRDNSDYTLTKEGF